MAQVINQSELSSDPDVADWLFENAMVDYNDPLAILLQREMEETEDVEHPYLASSTTVN